MLRVKRVNLALGFNQHEISLVGKLGAAFMLAQLSVSMVSARDVREPHLAPDRGRGKCGRQDAVEHSNIVELLKISPHVLADEGRKHHGRVVPVENCKLRRCLEVLNLRPIILISKEFCSLECLVMLFVIYSGTSSGSPIFHKFPERGRLSLSWEENCTYSRGESLAWSQS